MDNVNANIVQNGVGAPRFHRTDIDVLKSCFTVVCFFLIIWGPVGLIIVITVIIVGEHIPHEVLKLSVYLLLSSSVVDPIIYAIMSQQF